VRYR
jgi:hypothetical protein